MVIVCCLLQTVRCFSCRQDDAGSGDVEHGEVNGIEKNTGCSFGGIVDGDVIVNEVGDW